ncbi:hypothetical protein GCM10009827_029800 [Dactylosporangium maewongense]|uniref:Uncharacterized protein n=1 Tax=Dactylosporangium maewongense TaxID=634393 RepID=A0ABP4KZI0_9ACTN
MAPLSKQATTGAFPAHGGDIATSTTAVGPDRFPRHARVRIEISRIPPGQPLFRASHCPSQGVGHIQREPSHMRESHSALVITVAL